LLSEDLVAKDFNSSQVLVGASQFSQYLPLIKGKKVGLVVNQTSRVFEQHLVDFLITKNVDVTLIFSPEHGFRGDRDAGEKFSSTVDSQTGIPLISLYGKQRKPSLKTMANLDVVIFDIQDVGVRFYTYISTMHYVMESAAEAGVKVIILDRPNPNGAFIDGPVLDLSFQSFVGMHPIPLLHGLTVAELAKMIVGEGWLASQKKLDLTVIKIKNYYKNRVYKLPVKPSPNLPNSQSISLYPSLGFFEATNVSIGRGTEFPFQVIGHDNVHVGDFTFTPISKPGFASKPKLMNKALHGQDLRHVKVRGLDLRFIMKWHQAFASQNKPFFVYPKFMDKLAGTDTLRKAIESGHSMQQIKQSWQTDLAVFIKKRQPYLLYSNTP
jgi:uncharacterized protein YbbC (DUF1343 family)